ncbi:MAG TPA: glycosyltransferase family 39 protein [Solirubrobacterales bacterium]|nr:glycosyltransferase family 39 protein [Solirubrobacterales bacterium]
MLAPAARWFRTLPARYGRRTLIALALIAALGLAFRAVAVVHPVADPADDSHAYYALAKSLYTEGSYGGPDFKRESSSDWSPGAPWLYAGLFVVTGGPREGTIRILEALMGIGTILVVFLLGWRLGGRWPALLGALGVAIYPPFIHSVGEIMSEPPAMLSMPAAILAFLWAWDRTAAARSAEPGGTPLSTAWPWLVPGFLFGVTAMFRPEYTLVAGAFVVFAAVRWVWEREWRLGTMAVGLMLVALLLPVLPWTIRNFVVFERFVPISTGGGKALYVGTFYPADGEYQRVKAILYQRQTGISLPPQSQELNEVDPTELFDEVAERYPDLPRDSALGKIGKQNFSKYFGEHPLGYVGMTVRKVGRMWSSGVGSFMSTTLGRAIQIVLVLLGIVGLVLLGFRRRWWETLCLAAPIVLVTVVGAASLAAPRRNEILMTLIFPLAGLALSATASALSSSRE